jgi:acetylornithine deacetylase
MTTHLDTVPPFFPPRVEGEHLLGRGVIDAKGIAAAMVVAHGRLLTSPAGAEVALLFVVGEETTSDGAKAAAQGFAPQVEAFVNGEPTEGLLCRAMKGVLAFDLRAHGVAAHSAYPSAGHSAVHDLLDALGRLRSEPWPTSPLGETTLNIGVLEGGVAGNVLAPAARASVVMRPTVDTDLVLARVRALVPASLDLQITMQSAPVTLTELPGETSCVVAFGSDVPHLLPLLGAPGGPGKALLVGPGSILDAHTDHERVRIADLEAAVESYARIARQLLAT